MPDIGIVPMLNKLFKKNRPAETADTSPTDACGVPATPPKGKVLVVDDDAVVRKTLNIKLRAASYQVFEASDGAMALASAREQNPDIIIMDIHLPPEPGMAWDGFNLMKWLGRPCDGVRCPFVVITGGGSVDLRDKAMAAGAVDFFQKPVDIPALLATIEKLVTSRSQPGRA